MALISAIVSIAGVGSILYMLLAGPITGKMAAIHLSGDVAGTIGFGIAAWIENKSRKSV